MVANARRYRAELLNVQGDLTVPTPMAATDPKNEPARAGGRVFRGLRFIGSGGDALID
jgi:hypothetical protein